MSEVLADYYNESGNSNGYFLPQPNVRYTYADYYGWELPPRERYELYRGEAYAMAAPTMAHQLISMNLSVIIGGFLKDKPCRAFAAPVDVRLFPREDESDETVVQPDIIVVCDPKKLSPRSCNGAPDLVVEILSPSTRRNDLLNKLNLYADAGVREYWIIDPELKTVLQLTLQQGGYLTRSFGSGEIGVHIFDGGLNIALGDIFAGTENEAEQTQEKA